MSKKPYIGPETEYLMKKFNPEYSVVERLLVCLMDGHNINQSRSRKVRLRDAVKALTDIDSVRKEEPDSLISRALMIMAELYYEDYEGQILLECGGPEDGSDKAVDDYSARRKLAIKACEELGLSVHGNEEKLRKKFWGNYRGIPKEDEDDYHMLHLVRNDAYDEERELEMLEDFRKIREMLAKYDVDFSLEKVFWRCLG